MSRLYRWRRRLRLLTQREQVERELDEELAFHMEMEVAKNLAAGMGQAEARRRAAIAFGGSSQHRERVRDARWLGGFHGFSPDFKLAIRMLRKNLALSVVGGLGMAVGIAIALGFFMFMASFYYSSPPLPEGDRIVALSNQSVLNSDDERTTLLDYLTWRDQVESIEDLAAAALVGGILEGPGSPIPDISIAEMTATAFELSRVPPVLGRPLLATDEEPGARAVVVVGYDEWVRDFAKDTEVIGREIRISGVVHTIVGVMPEGYRFPSNHGYWKALQTDPAMALPDDRRPLLVFGRLAPGVSERRAEAELATIGRRLAIDHPNAREGVRPVVRPYVHALLDLEQYPAWSIWLMQVFAGLVLTAVAVNVAVLVYARTAARAAELTVRSALGARRGRIVTQLFLEALVLSGFAAALGLVIAQVGYRRLRSLPDTDFIPYWISLDLSASTVAYAGILALFAAFVIGVIPALQATGRGLQDSLRELGGATGMRMGTTWTVLIVVQVAIAVAVLPAVVGSAWNELRGPLSTPAFATEELLSIRLAPRLSPSSASADDEEDRRQAVAAERAGFASRLTEEPGVIGVAMASAPPQVGSTTRVLVDGDAVIDPPVVFVQAVDQAHFEVLGVPLLAGRWFEPGDMHDGSTAVIVNRSFLSRVLGEGQGLGRRFRMPGLAQPVDGAEGPTYEVVGVVDDLFVREGRPELSTPWAFRPLRPGLAVGSAVVRTRGITPAALALQVSEIAETYPALAITAVPMAESLRGTPQEEVLGFLVPIVGLVTVSVLLLSAAGISALMSFSVTRRQREIGIRTALGAPRRRIVAAVFSRSSRQISLGLLIGILAAGFLDRITGGELLGGSAAVLLPLVALMMIAAGLIGSVGPARRALGIQPMDALRQD